jgi:hypothetical protein
MSRRGPRKFKRRESFAPAFFGLAGFAALLVAYVAYSFVPRTLEAQVFVAAGPAVTWPWIIESRRREEWMSQVRTVKAVPRHLAPGAKWVESLPGPRGRVEWTWTVREYVPERMMVLDGESEDGRAESAVLVSPAGDGSSLRVSFTARELGWERVAAPLKEDADLRVLRGDLARLSQLAAGR